MKKWLIIVLIIVLLIAGIAGYLLTRKVTINEAKLQKIRLNEVTRSVFYAPQYVAIAKGFMQEQGLEVELTTGQGADNVMTAVLAGQCEIGLAGPEASIYVYNQGKEDYAKVFAGVTQRDGNFLVSREKIEDFAWSNVKGKTIIPGRKGGMPYMTLRYVLNKNGINPDTDVTLDDSIKFDLMAGAFSSGTANYVTLFEPTATLTEQAGKGYNVASVGKDAGEIPYTAYFAKKSYIEKNAEIIQKFTNAVYKGEQWVANHTMREVAEVIKEFFPNTEVDILEKVLQSYKNIDAWKTDPTINEESFNLLQTIIEEAGELKQRVSYDKIIDNTFAQKVK